MAELNPGAVDLDVIRAQALGVRVDKAAAALPQTATGALFNVRGGRVAILGIVGEVTTIIQNQATNTKLLITPTVGTAVDICAVLNLQAKEVGTLLGITGTFSDAMVGANAGAGILPARPVVAPVGAIGLNTAASSTGATKWSIYYLPLDAGAYVEAA